MRHPKASLYQPALLVMFLACCSVNNDTSSRSPVAASSGSPAEDAALLSRGKKQFLRCSACHSLDPARPYMLGPHLEGIVGRQAASLEDFEYSTELSALDLEWTETELDQWLSEPQAQVRDMCMPFKGIQDAGDRAALISYLKHGVP